LYEEEVEEGANLEEDEEEEQEEDILNFKGGYGR
jgi:hypothetical protein